MREKRRREQKGRQKDFKENLKKDRPKGKKPFRGKYTAKASPVVKRKEEEEEIRLNKFISTAGVCSRRDADKLIEAGAIKVNDVKVTELGTKVKSTDKVQYGDQILSFEKPVYLLLNKPKDFITTTDDPHERKTVMELVKRACKERIYPVGRLDRETTGLLLFTNDGELAKKLTHPSHQVKKVYHVWLNKALTKNDMVKIVDGIELEDGIAQVDKIAYVDPSKDKKEIGIELHSGKNRIVRRIFEQLGYRVNKLDRMMFAGLTKKDLPRGKWRFLKPSEVNILKRVK